VCQWLPLCKYKPHNMQLAPWSLVQILNSKQPSMMYTYAPTEDESLMIDLAARSTAFFAGSRMWWRCSWWNRHEGASTRLYWEVKRAVLRHAENGTPN
jgi:hypothetical protein